MGVDIGTTGCKALVFDEDGRRLVRAYREYPLHAPREGWAELDSNEVCACCEAVMQEAAAACSRDPVRGLGISSQGEAFTPVGVDGAILGNAMVSSDMRAAPLVEEFSETLGRDRLYAVTGHTPHSLFTLYKLLWLRRTRPAIWDRAAKFYCFEDLLQHRLGLEPAISWPLAGRTMLFDVRKADWATEILAACGLSAARLSRPVPSGTALGTLARSRARSLGLGSDVLVVAGGHDQPCAALGAGAAMPGVAMYGAGTVECFCPAFDAPVFSPALMRSNLCTYSHVAPRMYTTVAYSLTGGNLLRWFRDEFGHAETALSNRTGTDVYELLLRNIPSQPTRLLVLPYFTPSGTPHFDTRVPGAVLGLRLSTTRQELLRGLLEGVALEMRLNLDILERAGLAVREFRVTGGGAKSSVLTALKADVLNRPITTVAEPEAGCLGVAMLACAAHRNAALETLQDGWVRTGPVVAPDCERAALYAERFEQYRALYPVLRQFYGNTAGEAGDGVLDEVIAEDHDKVYDKVCVGGETP